MFGDDDEAGEGEGSKGLDSVPKRVVPKIDAGRSVPLARRKQSEGGREGARELLSSRLGPENRPADTLLCSRSCDVAGIQIDGSKWDPPLGQGLEEDPIQGEGARGQ